MKSRAIIMMCIICCMIMVLGGCHKIGAAASKKSYPDEKEYVEKGIKDAQNMAAHNDWDGDEENIWKNTLVDIIDYTMSEDGHGIMLFPGSRGLQSHKINNANVLTTQDHGKTWDVNDKQLLYDHDISNGLRMKENIAMFWTQNKSQSILYLSQDYGKTFKERYLTFPKATKQFFDALDEIPGKMKGISDVYFSVEKIDVDNNRIYISWSLFSSSFNEHIQLGEGYCDFNGMVSVTKENQCALNVVKWMNGELDYIVGDYSDSHILNKDELNSLFIPGDVCATSYEYVVSQALNEIYARMGYDYSGTKYEDWFSSTSWYNKIPKKKITEADMNPCQKANIENLAKLRKDLLEEDEKVV